jgi:hypothetical protein
VGIDEHRQHGAVAACHDDLISAALRVQADARRYRRTGQASALADEYEAAQDWGELRKSGQRAAYAGSARAGINEIGLSRREIDEARQTAMPKSATPVLFFEHSMQPINRATFL